MAQTPPWEDPGEDYWRALGVPSTEVLARRHHDHWLKTIDIPSGRLPMAVEEWDERSNSILRVLSISARAGLAQAAFDAAMLELPDSNLYLREATRVLRRNRDDRLRALDPVDFLSFHGDYTIGQEDEVVLSEAGLRRALEALRDGRTAAILRGNRIIFRVVKTIEIRDHLPDPRDQREE